MVYLAGYACQIFFEQMNHLQSFNTRQGLFFISPWIIGLFFFILGPFIASFILSFTDYSILSSPNWVGIKNYKYAFFRDRIFWKSLNVTVQYVLGSVTLTLVISFFLALLLNSKIKLKSMWRSVFYLPSIVPLVALSMVWILVLNPKFGPLNYLLSLFGIDSINWLQNPKTSMLGLIIMSISWIGVSMIIFLAGLQNISNDMYEAADLEGATKFQKMLFITVPIMTPIILFNLIITIIQKFQVFGQTIIMTQGGPLNSTRVFMLYIFDNAFQYTPAKMGYACALAWILFMIIFILSIFIFRTSDKWVFSNE